MYQPMTVCISFLLRGQESGFTCCCSSLWPPEGRVQVRHSGATVSSAQMCSGAESRTRLDAEVLAKAIGAGAARRKHSLHHHGSPEPPQPHRDTDGAPGQALASDHTSRETAINTLATAQFGCKVWLLCISTTPLWARTSASSPAPLPLLRCAPG